MPSVKGQVVGSPASHASMSMLSFDPATRTFVWTGSTATAGSFCLFCENGASGLPTVTSVSPAAHAGATVAATIAASARQTSPARMNGLMGHHLPFVDRPARPPTYAGMQTCLGQGTGEATQRGPPCHPAARLGTIR
jgi:hypothetical protein